jgi:hypothetical protein
LPYALAQAQPNIALALNPNNPVALITNAEELERKLVAFIRVEAEGEKMGENRPSPDTRPNTLSRLPEARDMDSGRESLRQRDILRAQIKGLALRAIANDPLNASAFRLLAEVSNNINHVRWLMQESLKRSRREAGAALWLLNDSLYRKDYRSAIYYSDVLLRTRPDLGTYSLTALSSLAEISEAQELLIEKLKTAPAWRGSFFEVLPSTAKNFQTPFLLMTALHDSKHPVTQKELAPYLNFLIKKDKIDFAYNAWLQFGADTELANGGLLSNADFESKPSGLPFDWQIRSGLNAIAEIVPLGESGRQHTLHIVFDDGRIQFPEVSQIVLLGPGRYRLEGKLRGAIIGQRGLRWQLRCTNGSRRVLGETDMLMGRSEEWRVFSLEVDVHRAEDCIGQTLRLFHDSRSASEEFILGEFWIGGLQLKRLPERTATQ